MQSKYKTSDNYPSLVQEWHPELNEGIELDNYSYGSGMKFWWRCLADSTHPPYQQALYKKTNKKKPSRCPYCAGQKVCESNSLFTTHPHLIREWNVDLNDTLSPTDVTPGSTKKVWWRCLSNSSHHSYQATINSRTKKKNPSGCPSCAGMKRDSISVTHPHLIKEWDLQLNNNLSPNVITAGSEKKVWWKCVENPDHPAYIARVYSRTNQYKPTGCPYCSGNKVCNSNSFSVTHPHLIKEWDYDHNIKSPLNFTSGSHHKAWWRCLKNSEHPPYQASIYNRSRSRKSSSCPVCKESAGERVIRNLLVSNHVKFESEISFDDCRLTKSLRFDFGVFNGDKLLFLIEYDGIQHFEAVDFFGGVKHLRITQKRDQLKNDFCKTKKIPLIRITYKDFEKLERIIINALNKYSVGTSTMSIQKIA